MSDMKKRIVEYAKSRGVDLVGFGSIDRFKNLPEMHDPLKILPEAKTVIGLGFRVLRGAFRGVEDGSTYYQYTTMGIEALEETYMPSVMLEVCSAIEDMGYVCVPQKRQQLLMRDETTTNPEMNYHKIYRDTSHTELDFIHAALACGMGELGMSGTVLTDDFGPFQRFCFIITDAEIDSDELYQPHLCDKCGLCRDACSGCALGEEEKYTKIPSIDYSKYHLDTWQCAAYTQGASMKINPFMPKDALKDMPDRMKILSGEKELLPEEAKSVMDELVFYPPFRHSYATSICGRACDRACYAHLEDKGVLQREFVNKFRSKEPWELDMIAE